MSNLFRNRFSILALNRQMALASLCFCEEVSIHSCSLLFLLRSYLRLADLDGVEVRTWTTRTKLRSRTNSFLIVAAVEQVRIGGSSFELGERERWCGLDMDGWKFGAARVWSSGVQSGPRVLRDGSIMNPPVEISYINTNSFGMSMGAENSLS